MHARLVHASDTDRCPQPLILTAAQCEDAAIAIEINSLAVQTVKRSGIDPHPAVGIIPLGTGNDMARTFQWGATFDKTWIKNHDELHKTLRMMADAKPTPLDRCAPWVQTCKPSAACCV